jgi:hypothetical protein
MRSVRTFLGTVVLLLGVPLALAVAAIFGAGASTIIHAALGASFLLIAVAAFDFELPAWITLPARGAIGGLAAIFLAQATSDATQSAAIHALATTRWDSASARRSQHMARRGDPPGHGDAHQLSVDVARQRDRVQRQRRRGLSRQHELGATASVRVRMKAQR